MKTIATIIHHKNFPLDIFDSNGNRIYYEYSNGYWWKAEYDDRGYEICFESSNGYINDKRT